MNNFIRNEDFIPVDSTNDGMFFSGRNGVVKILCSRDRKAVIVIFENEKYLMGINTREAYTAYYPISKVQVEHPIKAVLMDLDGTTLYSEDFWIYVIAETMRTVLDDRKFELEEADTPFVSGHSVSEHLQYCINKYCPEKKLSDAVNTYYEVSQKQLKRLLDGRLSGMQIQPAYFLKEFLGYLSDRNIKVGLVTSGLYEKAYPEIWSVCTSLGMGKPEDVYDSIITAGNPLKAHHLGTMGELAAKPHPWLYLETALVGLGIPMDERSHVLGIEDSGAGICSLCTAGIPAIGLKHGNIIQSGLESLCMDLCDDLQEIKEKYL